MVRIITYIQLLGLVVAYLSCSAQQDAKPELSALVEYDSPGYTDSVRQYMVIDTPLLALTGLTLIDGTGQGVKYDQTLLLKNDRITAVGPSEQVVIPAGCYKLDLHGKTVIPGLVGTHNHLRFPRGALFYSGPKLYLAAGVTTIQTCGTGHVQEELALARAIASGRAVGPDIVNSSPYFTGPAGKENFIRFTNASHIRDTIQQLVQAGVEWFKVYRHIRPEDLRVIVTAAHNHGAKVTGHLCATTYQEAAEIGIDAIEHGFIHSFDHAKGKTEGVCDGDRSFRSTLPMDSPDILAEHQLFIQQQVVLSTTPAILEAQTPGRAIASPEALRLLAPFYRQAYKERQQRMSEAGADWYFGADWLERSLSYDLAFYRAGGLLTTGPDPGLHVLPGFGDQRNYELLVEAGFRSWEAIQVMTSNGARSLERTDIGVIAKGMLANLVVLDGDLVQSPYVIGQVEYVFKNGKGYDPDLLLKDLEGKVGAAFDDEYRYKE